MTNSVPVPVSILQKTRTSPAGASIFAMSLSPGDLLSYWKAKGNRLVKSHSESGIRTKTPRELKKERRPRAHSCWDHLIAAPLWPLHGVNLGTLLRTCDAVGACMTVPKFGWVQEAIEQSYTFKQRGCVHWTRPDPLGWLKKQREREDTKIIGVELADNATRLADLPAIAPRERGILVLGHERNGIPYEALDLLDSVVEIPMVGCGSSLNVAVAGSLVLYKLAGLLLDG